MKYLSLFFATLFTTYLLPLEAQTLYTEKDYWDEAKTKPRQVYTYSRQEIGSVGGVITRDKDTKVIEGIDANTYTFSQRIKQGKYTSFYRNGQISRTGGYIDNIPVGVHKCYHDNGKLQAEINFVTVNKVMENGKLTIFYEGSKIYKLIGKQIVDGSTNKICYPIGLAKIYDYDGRLVQEINFRSDNYPNIKIYEEGNLKEEGEAWILGTLDFNLEANPNLVDQPYVSWRKYYANGQLQSEQVFEGEKLEKESYKEYSNSGILFKKRIKEYMEGNDVSYYKIQIFEYNEQGQIIFIEGGYTHPYNDKVLYNGFRKYAYENGNLKMEEEIDQGKQISYVLYYEDETIKEKMEKDGTIKKYNENGELISE